MPRALSALLAATLFGAVASAQIDKLEKDDSYQAGLRAMGDELPLIAVSRFRLARDKFKDDKEIQRIVTVALGEALVRASRRESEPPATRITLAEQALEELSTPIVKDEEGALFWSGQAALVLGRFQEAVKLFGQVSDGKGATFRVQSQLVQAHLLASLGRSEEAVGLLEVLAGHADQGIANEARLLHASLLLNEGDLDAAAELIPTEAPPEDQSHHAQYERYLLGRIALARENFEDAAARFEALIAQPQQLDPAIQHGAVVGRAEALHASEMIQEAVELLVTLIDKHPNSPLLDGAMHRLVKWVRGDEQLRTRFEERLQFWSGAVSLDELSKTTQETQPVNLLDAVVGGTEPEVTAYASQGEVINPSKRTAIALSYHAYYLGEQNEANAIAYAQFLLRRLRLEYPEHRLAQASLLETAHLHNASNDRESALLALHALENLTPSPELKTEAAKLIALVEFKEGEFEDAAAAFERARELLEPDAAAIAAENRGISLLRAGDNKAFGQLLESIDLEETRISLQLERALFESSTGEGDARPALDRFLREQPGHRRVPEARLAFAELSLNVSPSDLQMTKSQLDAILPEQLPDTMALRHLLTRIRLAELTDEWADAIVDANRFLADPARRSDNLSPAVRLKLAEAYFQNGDLHRARLEFTRVANEQEGRLREVAHFFAAKAALKMRAANSTEEGIALLREVIAEDGILAEDARLLLAATLIEPSPDQALEELKPLLAEDQAGKRSIDALVLAAQAYRARGLESDYRHAISLYDRVLARKDLSYALSNRFHSLKGLTYEQLGESFQALEAYYRVINRENLPDGQQPDEWYWYEDCGFNALRLLEEGERWRSMVKVAGRLLAAGGPRATEAGRRKSALQLEHQFWDDE